MKKIKYLIALVLALSLLTTSVAAAIPGDLDGDDAITVSDALKALRIAAQLDPYDAAADVNSNGSVDVFDALQLLRCAMGFLTPDGLAGDFELTVPITEAALATGLEQFMVDRGMTSLGDPSRFVRVMRKAQAGEPITVGFIGGSVTYGGAATTQYSRWARVVEAWWKKTFPQTQINYVNAGQSGTPSLFGVHRVEDDLLKYEPDFVVIEFGVNDELQDWQRDAYASLTRRIITSPSQPATLLFFVMNEGGTNAQADQIPIGNFYDLPMISYCDAVWPSVIGYNHTGGKFNWKDICADWVHPTDAGHAMCGELINCYLEAVYQNLDKLSSECKPVREDTPVPYYYQNTKWYNYRNTTPVSMGGFVRYLTNGSSWQANGNGADPLILRCYGSRIIMPIQQSESDTVKATVTIDGGDPIWLDKDHLLISSGRYAYYFLYDSETPAWHTVELTLLEGVVSCGGLFVSWQD
ncbi:MAG: hypothetical protein J5756_05555 [Clostridia bacterium]|nr:hypothetical protein [Clostridia bacterium]